MSVGRDLFRRVLEDSPVGMVMVEDVTRRKRTEAQIAYQANLLERVSDAIVASDPEYRLTAWNAAAEGMYGWAEKEVLGRRGCEVLHTEWPGADADEMRRVVAKTGSWHGEATQQRKDGTRFPVEIACMALRDVNGRTTGYVSVNRDITARKHSEAVLRESHAELERRVKERTARLRSLAVELTRAEQNERRRVADILHEDLQQHLVGIQYRMEALKQREKDGPSAGDAKWVLEELERTIALTRELTTRLRPPVLYDLGLRAALDWLAGDMKARFDFDVTVTGEENPCLRSDEMRAFAFGAVSELLMNSFKHAGVKAARVRVRCKEGQPLTIEVADKGKGFDTVQPPHGTRMGLFGIRERVEALGGRMELATRPGKGTRVTLVLPTSPVPALSRSHAARPNQRLTRS